LPSSSRVGSVLEIHASKRTFESQGTGTQMGHDNNLDFGGLLVRLLWVCFLTFAAYNSSGYSYFHWVTGPGDDSWLIQVAVGAALGYGYYNMFDITIRTFHFWGLILATTTCLASALFLVSSGWVTVESWTDMIVATQLTMAALLTMGMCHAHIHYRLTGVKQIEETKGIG
jgi:hypothetical protein